MQKQSQVEKRYNFTIIVKGNGERVIQWDANQGLGGACHKASEVFNPGTASQRKAWEDKPKHDPVVETEKAFRPELRQERQSY